MPPTRLDVRVIAHERRYLLRADGRRGWHCFSYGPYYDADNTHLGPLVACSEHLLAAGAGFDRHRHHGVDIVTWVVAGRLEHLDADGSREQIGPGEGQLLRTGDGTWHAERNASGGRELRFVQLWFKSENADAGWRRLPARELAAGWRRVAAWPGVKVNVVRLDALTEDRPVRVRNGELFGYVLDGDIQAGGDRLRPGDQLRAVGTGTLSLGAAAAGGGSLLLVSTDRPRRDRPPPPTPR